MPVPGLCKFTAGALRTQIPVVQGVSKKVSGDSPQRQLAVWHEAEYQTVVCPGVVLAAAEESPDTACLLAETSYTTVRRWYARFRANLPDGSLTVLSGQVQVDESYFGKQRSKQPQLIVTGAIEPDTRKVMLRITNTRSQEALEQFVQDYVKQGALVVSDKWYAYQELPLLGYSHESCNHSEGHFGPTNQIEGLWSSMKRHLRKLYGCVPTNYLQAICKEWMARQNQPSWFTSPESYLRVTLFRVG